MLHTVFFNGNSDARSHQEQLKTIKGLVLHTCIATFEVGGVLFFLTAITDPQTKTGYIIPKLLGLFNYGFGWYFQKSV